jgi:hypothetical protein
MRQSMTDKNRDKQPDIPTDTDELAPDSADAKRAGSGTGHDDKDRNRTEPNPPHTTQGNFTSPKFGSAGSGGLELEPGLDVD